jgi:hypothetical protein
MRDYLRQERNFGKNTPGQQFHHAVAGIALAHSRDGSINRDHQG